jgi:GntR family transcriptional regulator / MocR family aminotransferase
MKAPLFEIEIHKPRRGARTAARMLHEQLRAAILDGRLRAGTKLPGTRYSRTVFGVSRNTAAEVYERLLNEGCVLARSGSGTYVAKLRATSRRAKPGAAAASDRRLNDFWLRSEVTAAMNFWHEPPQKIGVATRTRHSDFRPALVDSRLFPLDVFRRASARQLRRMQRKPPALKSPQGNQGNYALRQAIMQHIALTRGMACEAGDVLVTAGAQQAFDLLARTLVTTHRNVVACEDPGYPPMRVAFAAAGARVVPVPVDEEGLLVEKLPPDAGIICVCPSHQFPLGVTMSSRRRRALIEFARTRGAVIVEDDYDSEFRFEGRPLETLRTPDAADLVFYVGTFSKCMLPSLRLGFVVVPAWALPTLTAAKNCLDWHCPTPIQTAVASFIEEGHLARHVRKLRALLDDRRGLLLSLLTTKLANWLVPMPSFYGMHIAAVARDTVDVDALTAALQRHNITIHSLRRYYLGPQTRAGLVFGYAAVGLPEIRHALTRMQQLLVAADA